ncbi:MAG: RsmB/NOP family class I SAM-dependent RNA methyltransferase [Lachnospiraceae bacterium]|nr:RsmB/NOP family class I SAM-dependent RNA methyltransferase [Lachnospiraceae bacterium]
MAEMLPEAFVQRMQKMLGEEYQEFEAAFWQPRVQGLRLNGLKGERKHLEESCRQQFHLTPVPWVPEGFYYDAGERPGKHPYHEAGLYYIQEPSAMAVSQLLDPKPGELVLDLCAAPGGKSTQIAGRMQGQGLLVSNEIHPARAKILSQNVERMGAANVVVTNHDSAQLTRWFPEFFDKIVVDAPCSGEGMFRKDEAARAEWSLENVALCHHRQQEILDNAAKMLKPGGRLVYSTCTFAPEENEGSIQAFLDAHPEFSIEVREGCEFFDAGHPEWVPGGTGDRELQNTFRIWPHHTGGEGHYLASLRKEGESRITDGGSGRPERAGRSKDRTGQGLDREIRKALELFCKETICWMEGSGENSSKFPWEQETGRYLTFGEQLYYVPEQMPDMKGMKVLRPGLHLGTAKKNRFEPSHGLALFLRTERIKQAVNLDGDGMDVIRYLKGETLSAEVGKESRKGWTLITVDGFSLGWAKQAGSMLKNHYPKGLRWM